MQRSFPFDGSVRSTFGTSAEIDDRNSLLAGLSPTASSVLQKLSPRALSLIEGTVLWNSGQQIKHVVFPSSGSVSIRVPCGKGEAIEVASVGPEGAIGLHEGTDTLPALTQAVVQITGGFLSFTASAFLGAMESHPEIRDIGLASNRWILEQAQRIAACNAVHTSEQRICRLLLRASDALAHGVLHLTQDTIARSLGVRRTTATLIAQQLQARGLIKYTRGRLLILDRAGLEATSCNCYAALSRRHGGCGGRTADDFCQPH
jgi:CRP-like cAMP-binding protein